MNGLLTNWKTSAAGLIVIGVAAFATLTGVAVPGFSMNLGDALALGLALLLAKDITKTS